MRFSHRPAYSAPSAFSLVELSIVLVILGLLVGGVLSGQSLIRASELRSVVTDYERYTTATSAFRDKYFALPGDITNATSFWGTHGSCTAEGLMPYSAVGQRLTCNGNGDGHIGQVCLGSQYGHEAWHFWQHLANAGLIEGQYSGTCGSSASGGLCTGPYGTAAPGINVPTSKLANLAFTFIDLDDYKTCWTPDVHYFVANYGNSFVYGGNANGHFTTDVGGIKPSEAWNIDTKIDDGQPARGKLMVWAITSGVSSICTTTSVTTTAAYDLTNTTNACALLFKSGM